MVTRSHGFRVGTRRRMSKKNRTKGKIKISSVLQKYKVGDNVKIAVEPSYHKGLPHKRYFGKIGKVVEKRGSSYVLEVRDGGKFKKIMCAPIHIKK